MSPREEEVENFSINVTEALIRDWALFVFVEEARRRGLKAKHAVGTHTRRPPLAVHVAEAGGAAPCGM